MAVVDTPQRQHVTMTFSGFPSQPATTLPILPRFYTVLFKLQHYCSVHAKNYSSYNRTVLRPP